MWTKTELLWCYTLRKREVKFRECKIDSNSSGMDDIILIGLQFIILERWPFSKIGRT